MLVFVMCFETCNCLKANNLDERCDCRGRQLVTWSCARDAVAIMKLPFAVGFQRLGSVPQRGNPRLIFQRTFKKFACWGSVGQQSYPEIARC